MVKSVVVPWMVSSQEEGAELSRIFSALGFSNGDGWSDAKGAGAPYLAPLGAIELIHGTPPAPADVIVEVQSLESVVARLRETSVEILCDPYDSHWGSRICVARIGAKRVAFFEFVR
jgi:hypothetical protein